MLPASLYAKPTPVNEIVLGHQEKMAKALIEKMPNTKFFGGYYKSWYRYPNLKVDLIARHYYSWVNYDPPSITTEYENAKVTAFTWYPLLDDSLLR